MGDSEKNPHVSHEQFEKQLLNQLKQPKYQLKQLINSLNNSKTS